MANAAAKKAAAAREAAGKTYFPIVVAINLGYLFLRLVYHRSSLTTYNGIMTIILVLGSAFSYKGILEDHATSVSSSKGKGHSGDALAGGASLDMLGLIVVVQYGSVLISEKVCWLLTVVPVWGGWKLYSTFVGAKGALMPKGNQEVESNDDDDDTPAGKEAAERANAKREKRADRRRQKWG